MNENANKGKLESTQDLANPNERLVIHLAAKVAREIFEIGDQNKSPCTRIEFKSGNWPKNEFSQGGLCEEALAKYLSEIIPKYFSV